MSAAAADPLAPFIRRQLAGFVRRHRFAELVRRFMLALSACLFWMLVIALLDRVLKLPAAVRCISLAGVVVTVLALLWRPLLRIMRAPTCWTDAAAQMEQANPALQQMLSAYVTASLAGASSPRIVAELGRRLEPRLGAGAPNRLLPSQRLRLRRAGVGALLACLAMLAAMQWPTLQLPRLVARQLMPLASVAPATTTQITNLTDDSIAVGGQAVMISVRVTPAPAHGVLLRLSHDGQSVSQIGMTPGANDTYLYRLDSVAPGLEYTVLAGDAVSGPHAVRVASSRPQPARPAPVQPPESSASATSIRRVEDLLAELPSHLSRVEQAAQWARQTEERAEQARYEALTAPTTQRARTDRAVDAADRQADEALGWLAEIAQALPDETIVAREFDRVANLMPHAAVQRRNDLLAALAALRQAILSRDPEAASRAAANAHRVASDAQDRLRQFRQQLAQSAVESADGAGQGTSGRQAALNAYFQAIRHARDAAEKP